MKGIIKEYLESQARLDPYFNEKYKDFEHQADTLNQCLIANDYIKKVIEKKKHNRVHQGQRRETASNSRIQFQE